MVAREEPSKGKALLLTGVTLVAERTSPPPWPSLEGKASVSEMTAPSLGFWTQKLPGLWPGLQDGKRQSPLGYSLRKRFHSGNGHFQFSEELDVVKRESTSRRHPFFWHRFLRSFGTLFPRVCSHTTPQPTVAEKLSVFHLLPLFFVSFFFVFHSFSAFCFVLSNVCDYIFSPLSISVILPFKIFLLVSIEFTVYLYN